MTERANDRELAELGGRLRALREDVGLTQAEVAERLGLTDGGYGHFERGRRLPSAADLPWLASGLGVSTGELLSRLGLLGRDLIANPLPDPLSESFRSLAANWAQMAERDREMARQFLGMASSLGRTQSVQLAQDDTLESVESHTENNSHYIYTEHYGSAPRPRYEPRDVTMDRSPQRELIAV